MISAAPNAAIGTGAGALALLAVALGGVAAGAVATRCARRCFAVSLQPAVTMAACVATGTVLTLRIGGGPYLAPLLVFGWAGVMISAVDLRTHLIPTRLLQACAAVAVPLLCAAAVLDGGLAGLARTAAATAIGAAIGWGTTHVIWRAARAGLGYGDVRLAGYLGLHLGLGGISAVWIGLLAGFAIAAAVGAVGIIALGRSTDHRFALGPSLIAGALAAAWLFMPPGLVA